jgi:FkbM family methyltransferase
VAEARHAWRICATGGLKIAEVIFDVGANSGIYSLAALSSQPNAVVHAFEPTLEIAGRLRQTAQPNHLDNLIVHELAVMSHSGQAIYVATGATQE